MDDRCRADAEARLVLRGVDGAFLSWQPTVSDVLAEDWRIPDGGK
ncbi:Thoeris anti-defense Tad2 family protein [Actinomadura miaoliensis]